MPFYHQHGNTQVNISTSHCVTHSHDLQKTARAAVLAVVILLYL